MNLALGVFFVVFGIPAVIWPYRVARFGERTDALGSKRSWDEVEPTERRVSLTRIIGGLMTVIGAFMLLVSWS